jgi:uncharacterized protein YecE (DUF72 family)
VQARLAAAHASSVFIARRAHAPHDAGMTPPKKTRAATPRISHGVRMGISGWRHALWRGVFYPKDLAQRREPEFASRRFDTIEINGSFYSLQRPDSWRRWYAETPNDFLFAVKAPRYITHLRRLRDIDAPLANFFASGVLELREKPGPILWQFPPNFRHDAAVFDAFVEKLPRDTSAAIAIAVWQD